MRDPHKQLDEGINMGKEARRSHKAPLRFARRFQRYHANPGRELQTFGVCGSLHLCPLLWRKP